MEGCDLYTDKADPHQSVLTVLVRQQGFPPQGESNRKKASAARCGQVFYLEPKWLRYQALCAGKEAILADAILAGHCLSLASRLMEVGGSVQV